MTDVFQVRYKANKKQVISAVTVVTDGVIKYSCFFIELAWRGNTKNKSCIPAEVYECVKRPAGHNGSRFNYPHIEVLRVPGRSYIKWHIANHYHDLLGCMGPGKYAKYDIDKDGEIDVTDSTATLNRLVRILPNRFKLHILERKGLYDGI